MAIVLFEHNKVAYEAAIRMLTERGKAAVIHPTGTGKSFIGFKLCEDNSDKTICWLSPSRYIYSTQLENLAEVSGGYTPSNVRFFTYAKLMNMSAVEIADIKPDYIILDEFHRCGAELWGAGVDAVLKAYPDVPVLGLSATAIRYLDNQRNMTDELFDGNIASEMTLGEAIVRGILNPPKYILSVFSIQKDLERYEKRVKTARYKTMRDKAAVYLEALRRALDKAEKLDVMFDKHMDDKTGKYIVFCANYEHMDDMIDKAREWFWKVDKKLHIYKAYSNDPETSKAFADFKADKSEHLKLLYCIDMLNEGIHVEDISGVILLRPTVSPIIYKQQIGRALSASKSKNPVIFDIVNNIENLYSIDTIKEEMDIAVHYYHTHEGNGIVINDTFELIDKVADCKSLFEELEGTLSASWDVMYEKAKEYYEKFGDLEIPKDHYTEDGYSLGVWVATQRSLYRGTASKYNYKLTQVQIDKLNAIGMRWQSVSEISWERYYEAAKLYFEKNGDLLPNYLYVDENGINLGHWICSQRTARKNGITRLGLTEERIARLDEIGMVWDVPDYRWEENFSAAVRYHKKYGNLDVPVKYVDDSGFKLGQWLNNLRGIRKKAETNTLTNEQISRLDSLGMIWEDRVDKQWNDAFKALCDYYKKYNSLKVPFNYETENGIKLQMWVNTQRRRYKSGKLSEDRIKKLQSLGFEFEVIDAWESKFQLAKDYYDVHGNLDIPSTYVVNDCHLRSWLTRQKRYAEGKIKSNITPEQVEKLKSIGLFDERTNQDKIWHKRYEIAKDYFEEHGNLNVPNKAVYHDFQLGVWISKQRTANRNNELSQEKFDLLNAIGMMWENLTDKKNSELYENGFRHLEQYIAENGLDKIRTSTLCDDGFNLGNWVSNCRVRYKQGELSEEYIKRFRQLKFPLDDEEQWNYRYEKVKAYFEENGVNRLPEKYIGNDGSDLTFWLAKQRRAYKKGELSKDQMKKLDDIGYPFKQKLSPSTAAARKKWLEKYDIVSEYLSLHKGEKIDPDAEYKDIRVIDWIRQQRNFIKNGVITDDRVDMFNTLDWQNVLDNLVSHWDIVYLAAVEYFDEHGIGAKVEPGHVVDGSELYSWVENEIKAVNGKSKTIRTPEQIEKLKKIGIEPQTQDRFERQWLSRFEELKVFIESYQRLPLTRKIKGPENSIAVWLNTQKKKYSEGKLGVEQAKMLKHLGIDLSQKKVKTT